MDTNTATDSQFMAVTETAFVEPTHVLPASDSQQRLWFVHQLLPESPVYNIYRAIKIEGEIDTEALHQSINSSVQRHETLRTIFPIDDGQIMQAIYSSLEIEIPYVDLSEKPDQIQPLLDHNVRQPFDLVNGPLLRVCLIKLADSCHIFQFMVHHIVFDRRSLGLLNRELTEFYRHFADGAKPNLPQLDIQYSDYTAWRNEKLNTEDLSRQWAYWKKQLANVAPLTLPYDRSRALQPTTKGERLYLDLPPALIEQFEAVVVQHGVTMFMGLLTVFKLLIYRWSGETDILAGTPFADRRMKGSDDLLGFFVSTLVLRTDLSGELTFVELLSRVKKTCFNAYRFNAMPLEKIIENLQPERHVNRNPLFDMEFQIQKLQPEPLKLGDAKLSEVRAARDSSQYDLSLTIREKVDGYDARFEYRSDLFERSTIELLLRRFQLLLEATTADSRKRIADYSIVLPEEEHKLITEWNDTRKDYQQDKCLQQLFEEQVERTPDRIALAYEDQQLTYRELNEKANQLAHYLRSQGVSKEVMVAVCMERCIDMVVALYAILKAGGGYVPLDPDYPQARLEFMLEDINASVVLTQQHLVHLIPENRAQQLCLDRDWDEISQQSTDNPDLVTATDNLAYVIYTSGSTGNPKGVINCHKGIVNRLLWMQDEYQLDENDRVLQKTPYSFDVSVWEFFWPLLVGARLIVAKPGGHQDAVYLADLISQQHITTLHFVPSMLQIFVDKANAGSCSSVRQIFCSGEALPYELQQQFFGFCNAELHNLYGPTEAAVDVTYWHCRPDYARKIVPIGRPVANTQTYILDKQLRPVPVGSLGELHIGGVQVARGYLNRPELTQEKFIADPFSDEPGARLYKTGDLVRHLNDGQIEYVGRADFQVKIRGLRIELGEIEATLADVDQIKQCVVVVREDKPGDKRIVAYYETKAGEDVSIDALRQRLRHGLPSYMVPQFFIALETLPLSANGKVDRKALPAPSAASIDTDAEIIAATTDTERALVKIWRELIGIEAFSIDANFFELGGHSLLAMQAISRTKKELNIDVTPVSMLRDTLVQIASAIDGGGKAESSDFKSSMGIENSIPFYFGTDNSLYGNYHKPAQSREILGSVLLCSPILMESINAHWAYRRLATQLAKSGFHVLRFDYYATGDSLGDDEQGSVEQWRGDIEVAANELQKLSGCERISLVGLRFGATLAALSALDNVNNLVLWEPIMKGETYVVELLKKYRSLVEELNIFRKTPAAEMEEEVVGYHFTKAAKQSVSKVDLTAGKCLADASKVFLITSIDSPMFNEISDELTARNNNFEYCYVEDSSPAIESYDDLAAYLPGKSLHSIVNKLKENLP